MVLLSRTIVRNTLPKIDLSVSGVTSMGGETKHYSAIYTVGGGGGGGLSGKGVAYVHLLINCSINAFFKIIK